MKKIGILTLYYKNYNFGGQLQAYALQRFLSKGQYNVEQIQFDYFTYTESKLDVLKRKLTYNEIVHHLDGDPANNNLNNLIVISRGKHNSLHNYLNEQRAILQRCNNVNIENCWKTLIVPMTTTWLETTGVNVKKLWEIGQ